METDNLDKNKNEQDLICHWLARKVQPIILVYVSAVFIVFIFISYFLLHSGAAVKALVIAALGVILPIVLEMSKRIEYRLTKQVLEYSPIVKGGHPSFKKLFELVQLSHITPTRNGFKFYLILNESNSYRRFLKTHILSGFSGEVHVEKIDLKRVLKVFMGIEVEVRLLNRRLLDELNINDER